MTMDLLKTDFIAKGTTYHQIDRTDTTALYEISKPTWKRKGYEVFRIKVAKEHTWPNGDTTPVHEAYPGNEDFGKSAWYFMDEADARKRFKELSK